MSENLEKAFYKVEGESKGKVLGDLLKTANLTSEQKTELARNKNPEEKRYVFLIKSDDDSVNMTWIEVIGRSEAYAAGKTLAESDGIDFLNTEVLVEGTTLENDITLFEFLAHMQVVFNDTEFDVRNYAPSMLDEGNVRSVCNPTVEAGTNQVDVTYNPDTVGTDI